MGAWIEISYNETKAYAYIGSHPLWVRGLKSLMRVQKRTSLLVAPFMGAWIEIHCPLMYSHSS